MLALRALLVQASSLHKQASCPLPRPLPQDVLLRSIRQAAAAACCAELDAMCQALDAAAGAAGGLDAVVERVMRLAEQQVRWGRAGLACCVAMSL